MTRVHTWTIEINITEHEDGRRTHADATLRSTHPVPRGGREAHRWPDDQEAPETSDETAAARAFADLACKLLDVAGDIERPTHRSMRILS